MRSGKAFNHLDCASTVVHDFNGERDARIQQRSDALEDLNQLSKPVNPPAGLVQLQAVKKDARQETAV